MDCILPQLFSVRSATKKQAKIFLANRNKQPSGKATGNRKLKLYLALATYCCVPIRPVSNVGRAFYASLERQIPVTDAMRFAYCFRLGD